MNYIGRVLSNVKDFYYEINSATLTGAIDVVVVEQADHTYLCSPFHVRFGKMGVLRSKEKIVDIEVNGEPVDIHMKLGDTGEAFFVSKIDIDEEEEVPSHLATSPLPNLADPDYLAEELAKLKISLENNNHDQVIIDIPNEELNKIAGAQVIDKNNVCDINNHKVNVTSPRDNAKGGENIEKSIVLSKASDEDDKDLFSTRIRKRVSIGIQTEEHEIITASDVVDNISKEPLSLSTTKDQRKRRKKKLSVSKRNQRTKSKESLLDSNPITIPSPKISSNNANDEIFHMDDDFTQDDEYDPKNESTVLMTRSSSVPDPNYFTQRISSKNLSLNSSQSMINFKPYLNDGGELNGNIGKETPLRPPTPKSDSEFEISRNDASIQTETDAQVSWQWGELPHLPRKMSVTMFRGGNNLPDERAVASDDEVVSRKNSVNKINPEEKHSVLGGMLNFMQKKGKKENFDSGKGIYLEDLDPEDPEVADLYFPKLRSNLPLKSVSKDDDTESGKGPSLPHSPPSQQFDSDSDQEKSGNFGQLDFSALRTVYPDIAMSLCGNLNDPIMNEKFLLSLVTFDDFCQNPTSILNNPDLVFRINGKYYNWQTAAPLIISLNLFQKPLPDKCFNNLVHQNTSKKKEVRSSWWSWRRSNTVPSSFNNTTVIVESKEEATQSPISQDDKKIDNTIIEMGPEIEKNNDIKENTSEKIEDTNELFNKEYNIIPAINEDSSYLSGSDNDNQKNEPKHIGNTKKSVIFRKTLRLTSDQIKALNLQNGSNEVEFSVTTAYQGTSRCKCHIYNWRYDDKIIISDIDGTITKSDVLGHVLPMLGRDWAQSGVANLFTKMSSNGYKLLYLSARAIGQARITREYLKSIKQGDLCLPDGPLFLSPTSLISAFHREVIEKKPEEFKISCLKDIQTLFPANPFYAGFGNKINDTWAYRAVGIPTSRIFIINHRGELKLELIQCFQSSYTRLTDVVDHMFPPIKKSNDINLEYTSFNYWRIPVHNISDDDNLANTVKEAEVIPAANNGTQK